MVEEVNSSDRYYELSRRFTGTGITGIVAGIASALGADFYVRDKMRSFDLKVADATRDDILKMGSGGGIGAGIDSADINLRHRLNLINNHPEEYKLPRLIYRMGGKSSFSMAIAVAIGGAAAATYFAVASMMDKGKKNSEVVSDTPARSSGVYANEISQQHNVNAATPSTPDKDWGKVADAAKEDKVKVSDTAVAR